MSKVVSDSYPPSKPQLTDDELKQKFLQEASGIRDLPASEQSNTPTEIIELPSKGYFYDPSHPLASGQIEMKYMTAKEEDILSSQSLIKQGVVIDKLLQSLIVTKFDYNTILTADKNALFLAARVLAYGKDYEVEIACPSCGVKSKHTIDLQSFDQKVVDWSKFTKGQSTHNFTLPIGKKELTLKFLTHGDEKMIEEELKGARKVAKFTGVDPELTTRLKNLIAAVDGDQSRAAINKCVDGMLSRDSLALRTYLKECTPDIDTSFSFSCQNCGHEQIMTVPFGVSFFWPGV